MFLYGASGHAKVIIDILLKKGILIKGLFDDNPEINELQGIKCYGKFNEEVLQNEKMIVSIGENLIRKKVAEKISAKVDFGTAYDITAIISTNVEIGNGTVVMPGAEIGRASCRERV